MIEVWRQEGELCVPRHGYRATDIRTLEHLAHECANGLECRPIDRRHSNREWIYECVRSKPGM